jgi:hypothetical protein
LASRRRPPRGVADRLSGRELCAVSCAGVASRRLAASSLREGSRSQGRRPRASSSGQQGQRLWSEALPSGSCGFPVVRGGRGTQAAHLRAPSGASASAQPSVQAPQPGLKTGGTVSARHRGLCSAVLHAAALSTRAAQRRVGVAHSSSMGRPPPGRPGRALPPTLGASGRTERLRPSRAVKATPRCLGLPGPHCGTELLRVFITSNFCYRTRIEVHSSPAHTSILRQIVRMIGKFSARGPFQSGQATQRLQACDPQRAKHPAPSSTNTAAPATPNKTSCAGTPQRKIHLRKAARRQPVQRRTGPALGQQQRGSLARQPAARTGSRAPQNPWRAAGPGRPRRAPQRALALQPVPQTAQPRRAAQTGSLPRARRARTARRRGEARQKLQAGRLNGGRVVVRPRHRCSCHAEACELCCV